MRANISDELRWKTSLTEILTFMPMGYSVFEKVLGFGPVDGLDMIYLEKLAFRKQTSIARWEQQNGEAGISQYGNKWLFGHPVG